MTKTAHYILLLIFVLAANTAFSQKKQYAVGGVIKNATTGETLLGVPIGIQELPKKGVTTNANGFYSITLPSGEYTLNISYIGFESRTIKIDLSKNSTQNIELKESEFDLDEVVVTTRRPDENVTNVQTGVERLSMQQVNKLPVLMGERDIIKAIQLLPGVKSTGDGSSGMFVRGGSADQNSILLDNAPLYNATHLLGFFSTFNSDAIKDATLYKGAIPAQYGERLASVLDVQMRDGDNQTYHYDGGIGLISSVLAIEGPIQKGKSSLMVSGRRTYADLLAKAAGAEEAKNSSLYFYDLNAKLNFTLSDKDRLFVSGYHGKDVLGVKKVIDTDWGNSLAAIRWNRVMQNKLVMNTSLIYNKYSYNVKIDASIAGLELSSIIDDYILKQDFQYYYSPSNTWRWGYTTTYHTIDPGKLEFDSKENGQSRRLQKRRSWESGVYLNNQMKIGEKLELIYGARLSAFSALGGSDYYALGENNEITDTLHYKSGKFVKTYLRLEPRISTMYQLNEQSSIKAAYGRTTQNMHLLTNSAMSSPVDRWASSSNIIKPQVADQFTLGYFRNFSNNEYEFSVETYYKDMQNQIDFKDNADIRGEDGIESELLFGKGRAYGIEFLLKKRAGKLTGWIGYTLSRSEKRIDGINEGRWYDATQDRTHDISIVALYELNSKWNFSATWVYNTGNAVTYPSGKWQGNGVEIPYYTERNGYRAPAYHRLDLGATCVLKKSKNFSSEIAFGLYNAYGRENPYMIDFKPNKDDQSKMSAYQISLFRFVPSISWNFKFK